MSDFEIRSGGAVAVDTETLRAAADRCARFEERVRQVIGCVRAAQWRMARVCVSVPSDSGWDLIQRAGALRDDVHEVATSLRRSADLYESAELLAQREFADAAGAAAIDRRLAELERSSPGVRQQARDELSAWNARLEAGLDEIATMLPGGLGVAAIFGALLKEHRHAPLPQGTRPIGPLPDVRVSRTGPATSSKGPTDLEDLIGRIPDGEDERVRVERYELPDGTRTFAVYITGTRALFDAAEVWNMPANIRMFDGHASGSYAAVLAALEDAGAQPGDQLIDVGHSQGAMLGAYLAHDPRYEVTGVYAVGAPLTAAVGEGTLSVSLQHEDDYVRMLSSGTPGTNGDPRSFEVWRDTDQPYGERYTEPFGPHQMDEYLETARMVDASTDPRVEAMREQLARLRTATSVTAYEYQVDPH